MNSNNGNKNASKANEKLVQPNSPNSDQNSELTALEKGIFLNESSLANEQTALLSREEAATAREGAAEVRESAATLREEAAEVRESAVQIREREALVREVAATNRELEICAIERVAASDQHLKVLQQANEHLVIASIEAHKMAEDLQIAKDELDYLAYHDALTNLPNRMLLLDRLTKAIELVNREGQGLAVMFMDLDQFKHINDSLGHPIGDQLLQSVARRLTECIRHSDTISRQGGDEFVMLLSPIRLAEDVAHSAQKVLTAMAQSYRIEEHDLHISISIGISIYPDDGQDAETLLKCADTAMYAAKEQGRNNYKFFEHRMNVRAVQRQSIEASLRRALARKEFILYYQPKINLKNGSIVGVEALIRWQHPERGLLLPGEFVPIAENCGLILAMDRWVLHEACSQAYTWAQAGLAPITVAVNASSVEFHAKDFLKNIINTLEDTCLEPRYLEIEMTESILMHDADSTDITLRALSAIGVKLAIDDFGTGYSSLSYLRQFPIDTLKIDRSFVSRMTSHPEDAVIVGAVINLGKNLKQCVIAEGIETLEQCEFLRLQNCDEGQGYYFGRPMAVEAIEPLLKTGVAPVPTRMC